MRNRQCVAADGCDTSDRLDTPTHEEDAAMMTPGARLRAAWQAGPIMIPGAFNALTAKLAERLGFPAVYLSGGALSAGWAGVARHRPADPDRVRRAGGGAGPRDGAAGPLRRRHRLRRGDQRRADRPALRGGRRRPDCTWKTRSCPSVAATSRARGWSTLEAMAAKIRAAVAARRDPDFVIVARTDARSVEGFDAAVRRGRRIPRRRRRHDLPRGPGIGRRIRPLRPEPSPRRCWPT